MSQELLTCVVFLQPQWLEECTFPAEIFICRGQRSAA